MVRMVRLLVALAVVLSAVPAHAQSRRVAVLDFANTARDPALEWLGAAVAETLTTKLNTIRSLRLVERAQLYKVLQEQRLNLTDVIDPSQATKLGKLLGAEQIVLGAYAAFGGSVRFTARFVDATTGAIIATSQVNGALDPKNPDGLWSAFDRLAQATIDSLNTRVAIVDGAPRTAPVDASRRIEPTGEQRLALARAPTKSLEAHEAHGRGLVAYRRHQWPDAVREFERATTLDPDYAETWQSLATVLNDMGRWPESLRASERALALQVRLGDETGQVGTLKDLAYSYTRQGRYQDALGFAQRSVQLAEKLGDEGRLVLPLTMVGAVYNHMGRYGDALGYYERSLRLAENLGDTANETILLNEIGTVAARQGRPAEALTYFERSLRLAEKIGDEPRQVWIFVNVGNLHAQQNRPAEAMAYFDRGLRLAVSLGDEHSQAAYLTNIGSLHSRQNRPGEGLSYLERALQLQVKLGDERGQMVSLAQIGVLHAGQGRRAEALAAVERSLAIAERLGMPEREKIREFRNLLRKAR